MFQTIQAIAFVLLLSLYNNKTKINNQDIPTQDSNTVHDNVIVSSRTAYHETTSNELAIDIKFCYTGKIANYPVEMDITLNRLKNTIRGSYRYTDIKEDHNIYIEGNIIDNKILVKEYIYKNGKRKETGSFHVTFDDFSTMTGTWQNPKKTKTLNMVLKSCEILKINPLGYTFKADLKKVLMERSPDSDDKVEFTQLQDLKIFYTDELQQTLTDLNICIFVDTNSVELEDLNFDGYYDLKITENYPFSHKPDYGILYFIYNPRTDKFEKNTMLNNLRVVTANPFKKVLTHITADGNGNEVYTEYKWISNILRVVKKTEYFEDTLDPIITEYQ